MNRTTVLALVLALAGFGLAPAAGASPVPGPSGEKCFLLSATDLGPEPPPDTQLGVMVAGPLEDTGTLTCSVQVGADRHSGTNAFTTTATDDVVPGRIFGAELVSYVVPPGREVYVCAQYTEGSSTIYWTGSTWDTDANSPCQQAVTFGADDPLTGQVIDAATSLLGPLVVCPVLQLLAPVFADPAGLLYVHPSGDTFLWRRLIWDCAPLGLDRTLVEQVKVVVGPLP